MGYFAISSELGYDVGKQCHHDDNGHCYIEVQVEPEIPLLQPLSEIHKFRSMPLGSVLDSASSSSFTKSETSNNRSVMPAAIGCRADEPGAC